MFQGRPNIRTLSTNLLVTANKYIYSLIPETKGAIILAGELLDTLLLTFLHTSLNHWTDDNKYKWWLSGTMKPSQESSYCPCSSPRVSDVH